MTIEGRLSMIQKKLEEKEEKEQRQQNEAGVCQCSGKIVLYDVKHPLEVCGRCGKPFSQDAVFIPVDADDLRG